MYTVIDSIHIGTTEVKIYLSYHQVMKHDYDLGLIRDMVKDANCGQTVAREIFDMLQPECNKVSIDISLGFTFIYEK